MGAPEKAGAEDSVGPAVQYGAYELGIFLGIVLKIGVLDNNDISPDMLKSGSQGRAFSLVFFVKKDFYFGVPACKVV